MRVPIAKVLIRIRTGVSVPSVYCSDASSQKESTLSWIDTVRSLSYSR